MFNLITNNHPHGRHANRVKTGLLASALMLGLSFASSPVNAASACKGLDNEACTAEAACGWIDGYERKDGRTVNAFCRTKAKGRPQAKTVLQKNAETQEKVASN